MFKRRQATKKIPNWRRRLPKLILTLLRSLTVTMSWQTAVKYPIPEITEIKTKVTIMSPKAVSWFTRSGQFYFRTSGVAAAKISGLVTILDPNAVMRVELTWLRYTSIMKQIKTTDILMITENSIPSLTLCSMHYFQILNWSDDCFWLEESPNATIF